MIKRFMSVVVVLFAALLCVQGNDKIEKQHDKNVKVLEFLCSAKNGIYNKNEKITFSLVLRSKAGGKGNVAITVTDFYGKKYPGVKQNFTFNAGKNTSLKLAIPDPGKYGHFTLDAVIRRNNKVAYYIQSAFAINPPALPANDPWFEIDGRNPHISVERMSSFKRIGVGTFCLAPWMQYKKQPELPVLLYFKRNKAVSIPRLNCFIGFEGYYEKDPKILARVKNGFFPYSEEDYKKHDDLVRKIVNACKGKVTYYYIGQETDAHMNSRNFSPSATMTDHILRTIRTAKIIRSMDPKGKIVILNSCGNDYLYENFKFARLMMREYAKYIDYFGIDAYTGNWNGFLGPFVPPEQNDALKGMLLASIKFAREFQKPAKVFQMERGYFVGYMDKLNAPKVRDLVDYNVRSHIITRAIPGVLTYSRHGAFSFVLPINAKTRNPATMLDGGMWRSVFKADGKSLAMVPRASVCAYATMTRMLSFVSDPRELRISREIYAYDFKRRDNTRVIALWTTGKPTRATFDFPVQTQFHELMGNQKTLKKGRHTLALSSSPVFLVMKAQKNVISRMLGKAHFPDVKYFDASVRMKQPSKYDLYLVNHTAQPVTLTLKGSKGLTVPAKVALKRNELKRIALNGKAGTLAVSGRGQNIKVSVPAQKPVAVPYGKVPRTIGSVKYPENVYPKAALQPERNLFRADGTDIKGDLAASWDENNLYIKVTVRDRTHLQRQVTSQMWKDDCLQLGFDCGNNALSAAFRRKGGYDSDDYIFGYALKGKQVLSYAWYNGNKNATVPDHKVSVTRKGEITCYQVTIPWRCLPEVKVQSGTVFGFSFLVMDINDLTMRSAPYWLAWTGGIAGGQKPELFRTLILQK